MGLINIEQLAGWYNEDSNQFLCDKCFWKQKDIERNDYRPVIENEIRPEDMFICDACAEKFTVA